MPRYDTYPSQQLPSYEMVVVGYTPEGVPIQQLRPVREVPAGTQTEPGFISRHKAALALGVAIVATLGVTNRQAIEARALDVTAAGQQKISETPSAIASEPTNNPDEIILVPSSDASPDTEISVEAEPEETPSPTPSASTQQQAEKKPPKTKPKSADVGTEKPKIVWPVNPVYWKNNRSEFLEPHTGAGNFLGGRSDASVDLQPKGSASCGVPVYSMLAGTVIKSPIGGTGGNGVEVRSQYKGNTITISYAHGINNTQKKDVAAGEHIMDISKTGNATGCHVHIDILVNGKGSVCPQDVFISMGAGEEPQFRALAKKVHPPCGRL